MIASVRRSVRPFGGLAMRIECCAQAALRRHAASAWNPEMSSEQHRGQHDQHDEQGCEHGFAHFSAMRMGWNSEPSRRIALCCGVGAAYVVNVTETTGAGLRPQPPNFRRPFGFWSQVT